MKTVRLATFGLATALQLLFCMQSAFAQDGIGLEGDSNPDDGTISATATQVVVHQTGGSGQGGQPISAVDTNWTPPACWHEPVASPRELEQAVNAIENGNLVPVNSRLQWGIDLMHEYYRDGADGNPENYNLDKQGEGMWWRAVRNPNREDELEAGDCDQQLMFWADDGAEPDVPTAITPEMLAEYAYDSVKVPDTEIEMQPADDRLKVNLPTWIWQEPAAFDEVRVRAELPGTGLWAETTATPTSLRLDPGTEDAEVHPEGGECAIDEDGSVGERYRRGEPEAVPACGITYRRSSEAAGGSYGLKASITWEVDWTGSGGTGGDLPDGVFETTYDVTVEEIQTVVR
ncbi:hypothetical protein OG946_26235 [Streptomyces sp. NBC_01808]|uniref:hypothetical protein n=1 Tax=Streptomyces sp. NBC_01808 TaxID=2975947 RepID=UPI002DD86BAE|nr:hypothetical protein [Streptomyces sp. NBC_01808]WSA40563.1 hypothetical protein OG946_26235 [Streptomyces sp. NBC_01808]